MRTILIVLMIITLAVPVTAQTFERDLSIETDGEIDYHSKMGSNMGETVTAIEGEGRVDYRAESAISEDSVDHTSDIEFVNRDGLTVITGTKFGDNIYVSGAQPEESGHIYQSVELSNHEFASMVHNLDAVIDYGLYQHRIDMVTDITELKEMLEIYGRTKVQDMIKYEIEDE